MHVVTGCICFSFESVLEKPTKSVAPQGVSWDDLRELRKVGDDDESMTLEIADKHQHMPIASRRGSLRPIQPKDRYETDANQQVIASHTIRFRHDPVTTSIDATYRLTYQVDGQPKRVFHVAYAFDPDERRREIEVHVIERPFERHE